MNGRKLVDLVLRIGLIIIFRSMPLISLVFGHLNIITPRYLQKFETHVPPNAVPLPEDTERGTSGPVRVSFSYLSYFLTTQLLRTRLDTLIIKQLWEKTS